MIQSDSLDHDGHILGMRRSVFWRVAGVLVGVQIATGLMAVALSAWFAHDRGLDLVGNSLRLRLDRLATEVEQRGFPLEERLSDLPTGLRFDLSKRFPDAVYLLDPKGNVLSSFDPARDDEDRNSYEPARKVVSLPIDPGKAFQLDSILVSLNADAPGGTWGLAPLYRADGSLAGGLVVQPLEHSIDREMAGTKSAFMRALWVVSGIAVLIAILLGAFFTWHLVRPLRRMTRKVERIGAGDYDERIAVGREDEFGRLARAINQMAAEVQSSITALHATDRLRRDLIANIGHDLRTPLAAMLGYVEEARQKIEAGRMDVAHDALTTASRQGDYLRNLVSDLFELSLLDHVAPTIRCEPIPLGELLRDAAESHQRAFQEADITLALSLPRSLPVIEGDGVRLLRVLDNLLSNARRHTDAGGTVILRAEISGTEARIEVEDNGRGMTPDIMKNVFERYYRGTDARTRETRGTGLGLPISRAIARAHGGDLLARSTPGTGSVFSLQIPIRILALAQPVQAPLQAKELVEAA